ncbi:MAG: hypothetical protein AVDCRST_MAG56-5180 [uncultured Cytophagales bacterium]|uniref:Uncharacterized protein n=1 Tax=uncultured Cytophagales bacterium TaxID=158755 RepID=A0A6J4K6P6_9SPHI|nr:MAG: hypothetical protein AVDCRST_MAG56-5180 [uncultured Cytophagales bacterium]
MNRHCQTFPRLSRYAHSSRLPSSRLLCVPVSFLYTYF